MPRAIPTWCWRQPSAPAWPGSPRTCGCPSRSRRTRAPGRTRSGRPAAWAGCRTPSRRRWPRFRARSPSAVRWETPRSARGSRFAAPTKAGPRARGPTRSFNSTAGGTEMLASDARLLPRADVLARLHAAEVPQKDDFCGAFCTLLALKAAGYELDQDDVAVAAGTTISPTGHAESLPPGQQGRRDYRLNITVEHDEDRSGTAAGGLVRAVPELTGGERVAVPVAGPFTPETVDAVMAVAQADDDAALVLNVGTQKWWGSKPSAAEVVAYLET